MIGNTRNESRDGDRNHRDDEVSFSDAVGGPIQWELLSSEQALQLRFLPSSTFLD